MPLLRITCPSGHTERIVELLHTLAEASEVAVIPSASHLSGGDLILAEIPRSSVDEMLTMIPNPATVEDIHVSVQASERLWPRPDDDDADDEAVVWAQVVQDVHETGRLSWINVLLVTVAAGIAAIGIIQDQLLLIVGAMAMSPDYFPIADTCLSVVRNDWHRAVLGLRTLTLSFAAGAAGAWVLTVALDVAGIASSDVIPDNQFTLFISQPDALSVVVALLAGVAGALAITLPDARGLVGVFVSVTTIPAAANIGVALASRDHGEVLGAAVQLGVNVVSLLIAGIVTLEVRRRVRGVNRHIS